MRLIISTAPPDEASRIVETLVAERLIACGNIIPGVTSCYRWKGEIHRDQESIIMMETSLEALESMRARLRALHPYETPKILTLKGAEANADFLAWVQEQCRAEAPSE